MGQLTALRLIREPVYPGTRCGNCSYRRRGATVLLTTHNMEEAEALCRSRIGTSSSYEVLQLFEDDPETDAVVLRCAPLVRSAEWLSSVFEQLPARALVPDGVDGPGFPIPWFYVTRSIAPDDPDVLRRLLAGTIVFGVTFSIGMLVGQNVVAQRFMGNLRGPDSGSERPARPAHGPRRRHRNRNRWPRAVREQAPLLLRLPATSHDTPPTESASLSQGATTGPDREHRPRSAGVLEHYAYL